MPDMASLFQKEDSPFWQLRYRDDAGKWRKRTTKFRIGIGTETAEARRECAAQTLRERSANRAGEAPLWKNWVQDWIDDHFSNPRSRTRAVNAWTHLEAWLEREKFTTPAFVRYEHAAAYLRQRKKEGAAHNTALLEVKFMSEILQEAVRRTFIPGNPWVKLGMKRERGKVKPEITADQAEVVTRALVEKKKPQWMHDSWLIYTCQGVRCTEADVPMADVQEDLGVIWFGRTKGDRPFATKIHPDLMPLIKRRRKEGAERLVDLPPNAAKRWWIFLKKRLKLPFSIHSTRVTVATQMARAGVDKNQAMAFLNHSSELVHRTYQRLRPDDLSAAVSAVGFSRASENTGAKPET
jgi:site-specific recombinase XerD